MLPVTGGVPKVTGHGRGEKSAGLATGFELRGGLQSLPPQGGRERKSGKTFKRFGRTFHKGDKTKGKSTLARGSRRGEKGRWKRMGRASGASGGVR